MVLGCAGTLLVALSARARSTKPVVGSGVLGGPFGLLNTAMPAWPCGVPASTARVEAIFGLKLRGKGCRGGTGQPARERTESCS